MEKGNNPSYIDLKNGIVRFVGSLTLVVGFGILTAGTALHTADMNDATHAAEAFDGWADALDHRLQLGEYPSDQEAALRTASDVLTLNANSALTSAESAEVGAVSSLFVGAGLCIAGAYIAVSEPFNPRS
ncbi:MAG TPA: hypothetical protein PKA02_02110 [Candidatus Saccharibacteria bacterium]|nr:hypothetical protein [Candidatus Saccharibacteria bacterium]